MRDPGASGVRVGTGGVQPIITIVHSSDSYTPDCVKTGLGEYTNLRLKGHDYRVRNPLSHYTIRSPVLLSVATGGAGERAPYAAASHASEVLTLISSFTLVRSKPPLIISYHYSTW